MLSEQVQYQGKAGFLNGIFNVVVLKILTYQSMQGFAQTVTYIILLVSYFFERVILYVTITTYLS